MVPPHKWAVGTTFGWEFDFPITTNSAYELKPEPERKTRKPAKPKATPTCAPKTPKPATAKTANPKPAKKPKLVHLTAEERKKRVRARAVERRRKLKEQGLCKHCRQPAIPGQTRCSSCAQKHRQAWRPRTSRRSDQGKGVKAPNLQGWHDHAARD